LVTPLTAPVKTETRVTEKSREMKMRRVGGTTGIISIRYGTKIAAPITRIYPRFKKIILNRLSHMSKNAFFM
jgi:hypothetical protein